MGISEGAGEHTLADHRTNEVIKQLSLNSYFSLCQPSSNGA